MTRETPTLPDRERQWGCAMQVGVEEGHCCDGEREAALALRALRDEDGILGSAQPPPPAVAGGAGRYTKHGGEAA